MSEVKGFDTLFSEYRDPVYRFLLRKVHRDHFVADDLTAITFEKVFKNIHSFNDKGIPISSWIFTIARNTYIDYVRKETRKPKNIEVNEETKAQNPSIEERAEQEDDSLFITKIINSLSDRERRIVTLKFYDGLTNKQIAEITGLSETNVGTLLHRSLQKIKPMLTDFVDL